MKDHDLITYGDKYNTFTPKPGSGLESQSYPSRGPLRSQVLQVVNNSRPLPRPLNFSSFKYTKWDTNLRWDSATDVGYGVWSAGGAALTGTTMPHFNPQPNWSSLYNEALDRMVDKVRGSLDVSVDLLEGRQTLKMLKASDQVIDLSRTFVRRFGILKAPANAWLLYTYGIKPLVGTIFGIADEQIRTVINKIVCYKVRKSDSHRPESVIIPTADGTWEFPVTGTMKVSVSIGLNLVPDEMNDLARWSSLNPLSIAWETLPLSFVADWFLNVGGYLRSFETALLYDSKFRDGYVSYFQAGDITLNLNQGGDGWYRRFHGGCTYLGFERNKLTSFPRPELPSLEANLGSSRLLSAASLLAGLLKSR